MPLALLVINLKSILPAASYAARRALRDKGPLAGSLERVEIQPLKP